MYLFRICLAATVVGGAFFYGVIAHRSALPPVPQLMEAYRALKALDSVGLASDAWRLHVQPTRGQGSGVTVNATPGDGARILMAGFFDDENQIRLIERNGTVVRKWSLNHLEHFPETGPRRCYPSNPLRVDTHGLHMTAQGEVIFNYEYCGSVKLDYCGAVEWTIPEKTHHSLVPAARGGYWLLGQTVWQPTEAPARFSPFSDPRQNQRVFEDTIMRISEQGEIVEEFSIPDMMIDSGLQAVITAFGHQPENMAYREELVHANKVTELSADLADAYPLFEAGDLALSMRGLNLVMVIDPDTRQVKWHQTGPWIRQHDPEFRPDGRLSIFNNNVYRSAYPGGQTDLSTPFRTNIMVIDPVTRETEVVFGEQPGEEMLSVIRGQHELLENDGILITEFDAGRVLEVNAGRDIVWEYVNQYNDAFVGEITNAMLIPAGYLDGADTTCAS